MWYQIPAYLCHIKNKGGSYEDNKRKFYYIAAVLSLIFTLSSCEYVGLGIESETARTVITKVPIIYAAVSGLMNGQMNMVFTTIRKFVFTRTIRE